MTHNTLYLIKFEDTSFLTHYALVYSSNICSAIKIVKNLRPVLATEMLYAELPAFYMQQILLRLDIVETANLIINNGTVVNSNIQIFI